MTNLNKSKFLAFPVVLSVMLFASGCGVSIGPQAKRETVFIHTVDDHGRPVAVGQVARNVTVPIMTLNQRGEPCEARVDIGGWNVSVPEAGPPAPERQRSSDHPKSAQDPGASQSREMSGRSRLGRPRSGPDGL